MPPLQYELMASQKTATGHARLGRVMTPHGSFNTPAFMPVGTQGSIKGLLPQMVRQAGAEIILANTYHLMLRPGENVVAALGDLHRFMAWSGPILTDSGGFQVFSLSGLNRISDSGVIFKSHVDGSLTELTAARSMQVQNALGADIIMAFDQCPPSLAARDVQEQAMCRTLRWARQCQQTHARPDEQALFAIVQGGTDLQLRAQCANELVAMDFPGYAIGGLAVGEGFGAMCAVLQGTTSLLPSDKPRYLMGVGFPRDIIAAVTAGIDMFDCVMPTRNGRNAYAFTAGGSIRLRNSQFIADPRPVEEGCDCYACCHFTRGAIRHFFFAGEMLGPILLSLHNTRFYQRLMADIRQAIGRGAFEEFCKTDRRCQFGPRASNAARAASD